jgi:hypothetical protein
LGSTEELVRVERVGTNKSKKTKLDVYTPSDPIKTTHEHDSSKISENFSEQQNAPLQTKTGRHSRYGCDGGTKTHSQ